MELKQKSARSGSANVSLKDKHFINVYEQDYRWLRLLFEKLGFSRKMAYRYKGLHLTDDFIHEEYHLSLTLILDFSQRRKNWDALSLWLIQDANPSVQMRWRKNWESELDEDKLEKELKLAVVAFVNVKGVFAEYDDNEPIYWHEGGNPSLRSEDYYIADDEKWIHAKTIGDLYVKAYRLGCIQMTDIRPVKISAGKGCAIDKDRHPTGGIVWNNEVGAIININDSQELIKIKRQEETLLISAREELTQRVKDDKPEIFPCDDVAIHLSQKIAPIYHHLSCPRCGKPSQNLRWIDYRSPGYLWKEGCGSAGKLSICDDCGWQIEFIRDNKVREGIKIPGGCVIDDDSLKYRCNDCG
jgi:hypothetical protein